MTDAELLQYIDIPFKKAFLILWQLSKRLTNQQNIMTLIGNVNRFDSA
jgi:hypothetical protein